MKTWGDIFNKWRRRGVDPAYAAFMAEQYIKRLKEINERLKELHEKGKPKLTEEQKLQVARLVEQYFQEHPLREN